MKWWPWGGIGFALAAVAALIVALLPATGWLVRLQLRTLVGAGISWQDNSFNRRTERFARKARPEDYLAQLAGAVSAPESEKVDRLLALEPRFADRPSLYAHVLRYLTQQRVRLHRAEESLLTRASKAGTPSAQPPAPPRPEDLALFDRLVQEGMARDGRNAFFPTMGAISLYAQKRDEEAESLLARAATLDQWEDYCAEETDARFDALSIITGDRGSVARMAIAASTLFPHYANLRSVARVATARAILLEQQGETAEGYALRYNVARIGATMRVQARSIIGNLVGIALTAITITRPGGEAIRPPGKEEDAEKRSQEKWDRFEAYLTRIGHGDDAAWYGNEIQKGKEVKSVINQGTAKLDFDYVAMVGITVRRVIGYLFLLSAFWTMVMGGSAALLARSARMKEGLPLSPATACGIGWFFGLVILLTTLHQLTGDPDWVSVFPCVLLTYIAPLFFLWKRSKGTPWWQTLLGLLAPGALILAVAGGAYLSTRITLLPAIDGIHLLEGIYRGDDSGMSAENQEYVRQQFIGQWRDFAFLLPLLLIPAMTVFLLVIVSMGRRVPVSVGLARGFRAAAPLVAAILLVGYIPLTVTTARLEAQATARIREMTVHEGVFFSKIIGKPWPGFVHRAG